MLMLNILCVLGYFLLAYVVVRIVTDFNHKLDSFVSTHNANVQATNNRFSSIDHRITEIKEYQDLDCTRINEADEQIDQILDRLNAITEDIARIDHDEKEIRKYYMNYREPAHPNGGVSWSETVKVTEDDE